MHEVSPARRQQPRRLVTHHPPVRDGHELGPAVPGIDPQVVDDVGEVLGAARVLDVEEDRAPAGRPRPLGLGRRHASGERALDGGDGERKGLGLVDDSRDDRDDGLGGRRLDDRPTGPRGWLPAASSARRRAGSAASRLLPAAVSARAGRHGRLSVTHDGRFARARREGGRRARSGAPGRAPSARAGAADPAAILPLVNAVVTPPVGQPLQLVHPVLPAGARLWGAGRPSYPDEPPRADAVEAGVRAWRESGVGLVLSLIEDWEVPRRAPGLFEALAQRADRPAPVPDRGLRRAARRRRVPPAAP